MSQEAAVHETLRKLAMIHEGFIQDKAGLALDLARTPTLVLLVTAPVAGLGRAVCAAPELAAALGYDIEAALYDPDDP